MFTFLLLVSFLLHMITLTIIYQFVKQIKELKQNSNTNTAELMETYLKEIKEENRMLEAHLGDTNKNIPPQKQHEKGYVKQKKDFRTLENEREEDPFFPSPADPETGMVDTYETSQQARILQLHEQGLSNEDIASKLYCGKTEVDLVIKLHPKTNNNA